ncbi:MAG: barstar family protein [Betaproteobacteria bacterium]|nr:barstar family protein [Betaproteobacteria bacterium]
MEFTAQHNGLYGTGPSQELDAFRAAARSRGVRWLVVDCAGAASKSSLLETLRAGLRLPDYFGLNWDALEECVTDPGWLPPDGCAIVLDNLDALAATEPDALTMMLEIFGIAADYWRDEEIPFFLLARMERAGDFGLGALG